MDVWVQGAFETVFRVVLNPDFNFFSGRLGIRERRELWLGSSVPTLIELQTPMAKWILDEIRISLPSQHVSELFSE